MNWMLDLLASLLCSLPSHDADLTVLVLEAAQPVFPVWHAGRSWTGRDRSVRYRPFSV